MPYPNANARSWTDPNTALEPQVNAIPGGIGNAHTFRGTSNGLSGQPLAPYDVPDIGITFPAAGYLNRGGLPTGLVDRFYATMAFRLSIPGLPALNRHVAFLGGANQRVIVNTNGTLNLNFSFGDTNLGLVATALPLSAGVLTNVVCRWRGDITAAGNALNTRVECYFNGTPVIDQEGAAIGASGKLNLSALTQFVIGANNTGVNQLDAGSVLKYFWFHASDTLSEGYVAPGNFAGPLGADGGGPAGVQPLVFFGQTQALAGWNAGTNLGTGGAFTKAGVDPFTVG